MQKSKKWVKTNVKSGQWGLKNSEKLTQKRFVMVDFTDNFLNFF